MCGCSGWSARTRRRETGCEGADWVSDRAVLDLAAVGVAAAETGPAMSDLADWLLEQITADERTVHAAGPVRLGWATLRQRDGSMRYTTPVAESTEDTWVAAGHRFTVKDPVLVVFDPAERRAELAAKRRIIELHTGMHECPARGEDGIEVYTGYVRDCLTLRVSAEPYAGRAGYQAGWAL